MSTMLLCAKISDGYQIAAIIAAVAVLVIGLSLIVQAVIKCCGNKNKIEFDKIQSDRTVKLLSKIYNFDPNEILQEKSNQSVDVSGDITLNENKKSDKDNFRVQGEITITKQE